MATSALPWLLWTLCGVSILAGLIALGFWFRGDASRGRRRCPRCWYEIGEVKTTRCPECGRIVGDEREWSRTRRRAGVLFTAILLLLWPVLVLVGRHRLERLYYAIMPTWTTLETIDLGTARVRVQKVRDPEGFGERCVIQGPVGGPLIVEDVHLELGAGLEAAPHNARIGLGEDITGDGVLDLVITTYTGGAHCCFGIHIVSLGETPSLLQHIDAQDGGTLFRAVDGTIEYRGYDWAYAYWKSPFVSSPRPAIVLRWTGTRFGVYAQGMLKPAPRETELDTSAGEIAQAMRERKEASDPPPMLGAMLLDLMYTGHEARAWALLDQAWPAEVPGKDLYTNELRHLMSESAYWAEFKAQAEALSTPGGH